MLCKIARMNGMRQPIQTALNRHSLYQDPSDKNNETSHQAQDVSTANAKPRSKRTSQFQRGSHRSQPFMQCSTAPHPWDKEMQFDFPPTTLKWKHHGHLKINSHSYLNKITSEFLFVFFKHVTHTFHFFFLTVYIH